MKDTRTHKHANTHARTLPHAHNGLPYQFMGTYIHGQPVDFKFKDTGVLR